MTSVVTETKPEFIITPDKSATFVFLSESVSEGHPDKFCDFIADSVLDAYLDSDPRARVACEVLCKSDTVVLGGEISSTANVDRDAIVREAIRHIGYTKDDSAFNPRQCACAATHLNSVSRHCLGREQWYKCA